MHNKNYILLVEADQNRESEVYRLLKSGSLASLFLEISRSPTLAHALKRLAEAPNQWHTVITDLELPDSSGLDTFSRLHHKFKLIPIVIMVPSEEEAQGKQALVQGAHDYFIKGKADEKEIHRILRHAIEKRKLWDRLNQNEASQFRYLVEKSTQGQVVVDLKGSVQYANRAAGFILGKSHEKIIGKPFEYQITPNKITELKIPTAEGENKVVETHVTEVNWNGKPAYLVALHDITSLEVIEHLKAEIIQTRKLDRLKDEFVSAVSHELRTPLTIIKGAIDNLKDGVMGTLSDKQNKIVTIAYNNSNRLVKIINNLLDLSRLESGHSHFNRETTKITPLIQEVMRNFEVPLSEKELNLKVETPVDLPEIYADPDMVVQVLTNLLDNAVRYARHHIHLSTAKTEIHHRPSVEIIITDDGPGIPMEKRENLFSKFVQINRPRGGAGYKGTGLGLAICHEIVSLHHGEIWVDGGEAGGCRFHVIFPMHPSENISSSTVGVELGHH